MPATTKPKPSRASRPKFPGETFWYLHEMFIFDVDHANRLVLDGREPVELEEASIRMSLDERAEINRKHVATVDCSRPGIIAHVEYADADGQVYKGHVLIDGNHRAARCLELHQPFFAYLLTEEESRAILFRSPADHA